jgi:hypothetical protein
MPHQHQIPRNQRINLFAIVDNLEFGWSGRKPQFQLLSELFDLTALPSNDPRFNNAHDDIFQHTENNWDWDTSWVISDKRFSLLTGEDAAFLEFLVACINSTRNWESDQQETAVDDLNQILIDCGFKFSQVKQFSFGKQFGIEKLDALSAVEPNSFAALLEQGLASELDLSYWKRILRRAVENVETDPEVTIGSAKEIVESVFKKILVELDIPFKDFAEDMPKLSGKVFESLKLSIDENSTYSSKALHELLKTATGTIAKIRNSKGTGHGKISDPLPANHLARYMFLTSVALCEFLINELLIQSERKVST